MPTCFNGEGFWVHKSGTELQIHDYYANRFSKFSSIGHPDRILNADEIAFSRIQDVDGSKCYVLKRKGLYVGKKIAPINWRKFT